MHDKSKLVEDILYGRQKAPFWLTNPDGTYTIQLETAKGMPLLDVVIDDNDLSKLDSRLPEVTLQVSQDDSRRVVSHKRLSLTVFSHWQRKNRTFQANCGDALTAKNPEDLSNHDWYLHSFHNVHRHTHNNDLVFLRVNAYRVAKTASGLEYVRAKQNFGLWRSVEWLEDYVPGGEHILSMLEAIGVAPKERGQYFQERYPPTMNSSTVVNGPLDLFFD